MKTWDDWSDFEVNKAIANALGVSWHLKPNTYDNTNWVWSANYDNDKGVELPCYCNNPADMWPICLDNGISLINDKGYCHATTDPYETYEPHGLSKSDGFHSYMVKDKSKLMRAAAIVFLEMNGVKP